MGFVVDVAKDVVLRRSQGNFLDMMPHIKLLNQA